jgi:acyl-CoA reductase-like NAD-dependent aldehyde dehydrogenase
MAATAEVGESAAEQARRVQEEWRARPLEARAAVLARSVRVLIDRADEIAATVIEETGKPPVEALVHDVYPAVDHAAWLARNAPRVLRPERLKIPQLDVKQKRAWLRYEPLGIVGVISPYNIPFAIPFTQVATAVVAGNGVVLKPSEHTPLCGDWVVRVLTEAGAPSGLVRVVHGAGEAGEAVARDPGVAKVFFTGGSRGGRAVAVAAAERLCPVVLELGGKDPMLVFADADLDRAVEGGLWGAFLNGGQACVSADRVYVERPRYEEFSERLGARARELRAGADVAPPITDAQEERVQALVGDAVARGARVVADAPATVLVDVPPEARVACEEVFGPVVSVAPFEDEDDAIRLANDSAFGLGASVWTRDPARARRVAERIEAGMVWVNDYGYSFGTGQASWGGVKASGFGRTKSKHGLYECVSVKYVDADRGRFRPPWWFPYDEEQLAGLYAALEVLYGDRLRGAWRGRRELLRLGRRMRP